MKLSTTLYTTLLKRLLLLLSTDHDEDDTHHTDTHVNFIRITTSQTLSFD